MSFVHADLPESSGDLGDVWLIPMRLFAEGTRTRIPVILGAPWFRHPLQSNLDEVAQFML